MKGSASGYILALVLAVALVAGVSAQVMDGATPAKKNTPIVQQEEHDVGESFTQPTPITIQPIFPKEKEDVRNIEAPDINVEMKQRLMETVLPLEDTERMVEKGKEFIMWDHTGTDLGVGMIHQGHFVAHHYKIENGKMVETDGVYWGRFVGGQFYGYYTVESPQNFFSGVYKYGEKDNDTGLFWAARGLGGFVWGQAHIFE